MLNLLPPTPATLPAKIGGWLLSKMWPMIGIAGIAASLYLGFSLLVAKVDIRSLNKTVAQRDKQITQLTQDLSQCRTNQASLKTALDDQNSRLRTLSEESMTRLEALTRGVDVANRNSAAVSQRVGSWLSYRPEGVDVCARVLQIDKRFVQELLDEKVSG